MLNYIKESERVGNFRQVFEGFLLKFKDVALAHKKMTAIAISGVVVLSFSSMIWSVKPVADVSIEDVMQMADMPLAAASQRSVIDIPAGVVKTNPFVPYRVLKESSRKVDDVPTYTLIDPPEAINENSDAARVMDTIVSGILFDKYSPSAILNIEGSDYLVKKGDVVNNYKVLNITQDSVTVKLGSNTYRAGIGEILTEGTINKNDISNLNNKFGGKK